MKNFIKELELIISDEHQSDPYRELQLRCQLPHSFFLGSDGRPIPYNTAVRHYSGGLRFIMERQSRYFVTGYLFGSAFSLLSFIETCPVIRPVQLSDHSEALYPRKN